MLHCCGILCLPSCFFPTAPPRRTRAPEEALDSGSCNRAPVSARHSRFSCTRGFRSTSERGSSGGTAEASSLCPLSSFLLCGAKHRTVCAETFDSSSNLTCLAGKVSAVIRACVVFRVGVAF